MLGLARNLEVQRYVCSPECHMNVHVLDSSLLLLLLVLSMQVRRLSTAHNSPDLSM